MFLHYSGHFYACDTISDISYATSKALYGLCGIATYLRCEDSYPLKASSTITSTTFYSTLVAEGYRSQVHILRTLKL